MIPAIQALSYVSEELNQKLLSVDTHKTPIRNTAEVEILRLLDILSRQITTCGNARMLMSDAALKELATILTKGILTQCPPVINGSHAFVMGLQAHISARSVAI